MACLDLRCRIPDQSRPLYSSEAQALPANSGLSWSEFSRGRMRGMLPGVEPSISARTDAQRPWAHAVGMPGEVYAKWDGVQLGGSSATDSAMPRGRRMIRATDNRSALALICTSRRAHLSSQ